MPVETRFGSNQGKDHFTMTPPKKRSKHALIPQPDTSCDFCGQAMSAAQSSVAMVTNFVIRVDDKEKPSTKHTLSGECLGMVCVRCFERLDTVLKATQRQPHRVTLGLENESMLNRISAVLPLPGNKPVSHVEIENRDNGLLITYVDRESGTTRRFHLDTRTGLRAELPS